MVSLTPSARIAKAMRAAPSVAEVARSADLPKRSVQNVLQGSVPSVDRADEICRALGISLTIGSVRPQSSLENRRPYFENSPILPPLDPPPEPRLVDLLARLADGWEGLGDHQREHVKTALLANLDLAGAKGRGRFGPMLRRLLLDGPHLALVPPPEDGADEAPGGRPVEMYELETAAGAGAVDLDHAPIRGSVWFRREWLDRRGLDPTQCAVISVRGTSMELTLMDGCSILVARHRTRRREGRVYVVWTEDGLIVKRAGRGEDGEWMLMSDAGPPDWPPVPWPHAAKIKGEVIWTARTLVTASE